MNRPGGKLSTPGYKDRGENWFIIGQRHAIVVFLVGHEMWMRQRQASIQFTRLDVSLGRVFDAWVGKGGKGLVKRWRKEKEGKTGVGTRCGKFE